VALFFNGGSGLWAAEQTDTLNQVTSYTYEVKAKTIAGHVPPCQLPRKSAAGSFLERGLRDGRASSDYLSGRANTRAHPNQYCLP
jgi:hypothetical protein